MKSVLAALVLAALVPAFVARADVSNAKRRIVVKCPDLKCCPPLGPGDVCVYVDEITCVDKSGNPTPC